MKRILSSLFVLLTFSFFAQNSEFLGFFYPQEAHLVPASEQMVNPKHQVIKPNFKGRDLIELDNSQTHNPDWVWQQHQSTSEKTTSATILWSKDGLGAGISPPDPSGEADSTVVIEATNSAGGSVYRLFNKYNGSTVGSNSYTMQSLGGAAGAGDPIVLYYKPAKRWFITEFANSGNNLIVYVSKTSNPQGAYWYYIFNVGSNFPDYPKYALNKEADALVVTTNEGSPTIYTMRLSTMLTGAATSAIRKTIAKLNGFNFQSLTPVDLEGDNPAPAGMKPLFIRHRDDESHNASTANSTNDYLELWEMTINWSSNSTSLTKIQDIAVAEFDSKLCGLTSFACIKQPGTTNTLDPLREPVMYKAPMRVFSDHQTLLAAFSTDVDGSDRSGVRWVELRRASAQTTATWTKYQEGTYAPGLGTSRWMPSINMDKYGNILVAYSTSSNTTGDFPSIKMTGRKPCDPLGTMTMTETTVVAGTNSKTSNGDTRWGDYHHMCIDDFDGVTFYYSGLYQTGSNLAAGTKSRVSAIRFDLPAKDAAIMDVYTLPNDGSCGSSTQIGVVVENQGSNTITSGSFTWQVGAGVPTSVNYTSAQLTSGTRDTIFVTISGLIAGANTVLITSTNVNDQNQDDNTCNDGYTTTINSLSGSYLLLNSVVDIQPSCPGNNGSITLSASGGTAPYTYSLDGGIPQSNATFNNLAAGSYNYTVTDNTGCSNSALLNLIATTVVNTTYTLTVPINCNGESASITVDATGGQSAYTYSTNGTTYQASNTFNGLMAGAYTIYAKDANGCVGQNSLTINEPTVLNLSAVPTMITCNGTNNGSIVASASGGTNPYTYSIDGTNFLSSGTFSDLTAGNYTLTTSDSKGCISTFNTTITQPESVSLSGVSTGSTTSSNGTITLTGSGGLTPYTYSINGTNYFSGALFSNLAPGIYTCYVKDNNGCINSTTITVNDNSSGLEEITIQVTKLYPNPNNGVFELEIAGLSGNEVQAKLFNTTGQLVSNFSLIVENGKASKTIEMSKKLSAGTYYLGIYNNNSAVIKQFIKE
jgi:hypothetical protein